MKAKLSDYLSDTEKPESGFPYTALAPEFALIRAMGAGVKELEMNPEDFLICMRYAINANLYKQVFAPDGTDYPTILAMKITIV